MLVQSLESSKYRKVFGTANNAKLFDKSSHACFLLPLCFFLPSSQGKKKKKKTTQLFNYPTTQREQTWVQRDKGNRE
jgi:hypothetical protein